MNEETIPTNEEQNGAAALSDSRLPDSQEEELRELRELLVRTQASFENFRKQTEKRMAEAEIMAGRMIIKSLLPLLDNFQLALGSIPVGTSQEFKHGIELIYSQLFTAMEDHGLQVMNTQQAMFDPYYHEPLQKVPSELPENTIIEVLQKGFLLHGNVLRHAKVKLSAGESSGSSISK